MDRIVIIGAGGHAASVADALLASGYWDVLGLIAPESEKDASVCGLIVIGDESELESLAADGVVAAIGVGSVGDASVRMRVAARVRDAGLELPAIVHPKASVSTHACVEQGVFVAAGAVVGPHAVLGECCIVNSGAVVDHGCSIGAYAHIAPGAALSGNVTVGEGAHVGTGASVIQGASIGKRAVVGVGSAVVRDIPDDARAWGVPCKEQST